MIGDFLPGEPGQLSPRRTGGDLGWPRSAWRARAQAEKYDVLANGAPARTCWLIPTSRSSLNRPFQPPPPRSLVRLIAAGKHVGPEKPIQCRSREMDAHCRTRPKSAGLLVGAHRPSLQPGVQTCRRAIAHGDIGVPPLSRADRHASTRTRTSPPPHTEFLFARGSGPMFDMVRTTSPHWSTSSDRWPRTTMGSRLTPPVPFGSEPLGTEFQLSSTHVSTTRAVRRWRGESQAYSASGRRWQRWASSVQHRGALSRS